MNGHPFPPFGEAPVGVCLAWVSLFPWQGAVGTNITIKVLCGVMADASLGEPYARYASVARLLMDTFSVKCLDASYANNLRDMSNTSWSGPAAGGGACVCARCVCARCVCASVRRIICSRGVGGIQRGLRTLILSLK